MADAIGRAQPDPPSARRRSADARLTGPSRLPIPPGYPLRLEFLRQHPLREVQILTGLEQLALNIGEFRFERLDARCRGGQLLLPFATTQSWKYSGPTATIGARWDPIRQVRVGASVSWSGTLEAEPDSLSSGTHEYDMPIRLNAGASAQLTPRLLLTASGSMANWSSGSYTAPGTTEATIADRTLDIGAGLEWSELRSGERVFPLRLGVRRTQLPFHAEGEEAANELTFSGGLGLQLAADDFGPLAMADVGIERGTREGWESTANPDGLSEKFWRFTVSVSLFGR